MYESVFQQLKKSIHSKKNPLLQITNFFKFQLVKRPNDHIFTGVPITLPYKSLPLWSSSDATSNSRLDLNPPLLSCEKINYDGTVFAPNLAIVDMSSSNPIFFIILKVLILNNDQSPVLIIHKLQTRFQGAK